MCRFDGDHRWNCQRINSAKLARDKSAPAAIQMESYLSSLTNRMTSRRSDKQTEKQWWTSRAIDYSGAGCSQCPGEGISVSRLIASSKSVTGRVCKPDNCCGLRRVRLSGSSTSTKTFYSRNKKNKRQVEVEKSRLCVLNFN